MCGILGIIERDSAPDQMKFAAALDLLQHRGPDASGIMEEGPVILGHRRLSIIDLDPRSNQPFCLGPLVITYNGEIYNYLAVRRRLEQEGVKFKTQSDTEVIIAAYRQYGCKCLEMFEGMFAFAVFNRETKVLTLARDRFGEKPLYYYHNRDRFIFASEITPIEALIGRANLEIDAGAIGLYFRFSYIPAPLSPFRNMYQLEPGSRLQFDLEDWSRNTSRYYNLNPGNRLNSEEEAIEELRSGLKRSVLQRQSASDVPVATFLSGGVDSSIISALATQGSAKGVHAYSIAFPEEPEFDESPYARLVSEQYPQIKHTIVDAVEDSLMDFTDKTLDSIGEPYADASLIPTAYLCSHVEEKVVLGGDGADEIFAGYGVYAAMRMSSRIPDWVKRIVLALPGSQHPHSIQNPRLRAAALFQKHLKMSSMDEYLSWRCYTSDAELRQLGIISRIDPRDAVGEGDLDTLQKLLATDIRFNLPNDMLKKVDLASMQHSLEVRLPYLEKDLVELALALPEHMLINRGERKFALREAFRELLPNDIFTRRKQGFLLPIRRWFRSGRLREQLLDLAETSATLDRNALQHFVSEHQAGLRDHSVLLWTSLVFLKWQNKSSVGQY